MGVGRDGGEREGEGLGKRAAREGGLRKVEG